MKFIDIINHSVPKHNLIDVVHHSWIMCFGHKTSSNNDFWFPYQGYGPKRMRIPIRCLSIDNDWTKVYKRSRKPFCDIVAKRYYNKPVAISGKWISKKEKAKPWGYIR